MRYIAFTFPQLARPKLRDTVYAALLDAIMSGQLEPGVRIRDLDLAKQLGVSRTPVREAIQKLQDEGLVESSPGSSTRVTPIEPLSVRQAFPVVACLHSLATRLGGGRLQRTNIAELVSANRLLAKAIAANDAVRAIGADDAFHSVFLTAAANRELVIALSRLTPKVRRLEYMQFGSLAGRRSVSQHDQIIRTCREGDIERAAALVETNWLSLGELLIRVLPKTGAMTTRRMTKEA
jgi:DNA-binding GntR family transcriptional regulator